MIFTINDQQIEVGEVSYRELNHGEKLEKHQSFDMLIMPDYITSVFNNSFNQFREEIVEDYKLTGDRDPESFYNAGWPSLQELLNNDDISTLEEIIKDYLFIEFFDCLLPQKKYKYKFIINEIMTVNKLDDKIKVSGLGFYTD